MMKRALLLTALPFMMSISACAADDTSAPTVDTAASVAAAVTEKSPYPKNAWRDVNPENLLVIDTEYGQIGVELYPEIAPRHVTQIKTLARQSFYDMITFHRVIDGFMNQTGDPKGDGTGDSDLPNIEAEFTFRRGTDMPVTLIASRAVNLRNPSAGEIGVGFYKGLPVASQPSSQAMLTKDGKVPAHGLHCSGVTSMARSSDPNSGNSQFFLMRGTAGHLDTKYSIWGNTVYGHEFLTKFKIGTKGQDENFIPDVMKKVRIAADMDESVRPKVQVLKTDGAAFNTFLKSQKADDGEYPDICDMTLPSRKL
ncbi:MAG: peptidylprolyl isomerase [Maricaulaceae bacterium]